MRVRFKLISKTAIYPATMSFRFFNGRILTTLRSGLAETVIISPVKGLFISLSGVAGLICLTILHRPGMVNAPASPLIEAEI